MERLECLTSWMTMAQARCAYVVAVSTVSVRTLATVLGVCAFAGVVTNSFVLQPLTWRAAPGGPGLVLGLFSTLVTVAGPPLVYLLLTRRLRHRPATFATVPGTAAFTVPMAQRYPGGVGVALMMVAGMLVPSERVPNTDRVRLDTLSGFVWVFAVLALILFGLGVANIWLMRYCAVLTPDNLTVRTLFGSCEVPWSQLYPGQPLMPSRRAWTLPLRYRQSDGRARTLGLSLSYLHVDRVFLATVVRHYAEHAEHRAHIGTRPELERLEAGFAAWRATAGSYHPVLIAR
ncbi:hypothetical protein ACQP1P_35595 [Dactylosporangium sp. CA-052675]|uniref:hypothetical protein n=1 Tax=Dactylosporangium sp. CA-052675 TaxID=3239927 RepID=UPI003D94A316